MFDTLLPLIRTIIFLGGAFILTFVAFWTYFEGKRLKNQGAKLSPITWAILVYIFLIIAFPFFMIFRKTKWKKEVTETRIPHKPKQGQRILVIIAFFAVYILSCILLGFAMTV